MYSTCMFCHASLGSNESIEHFPIGRRLAFDAAKGRLWVICKSCERWNLTPLEERWEAIEECERSFSDAKLRASTEHVGLARLHEGTTLIRIGAPKRPEFAAWRYGDQFGRRRRKYIVTAVAVGAAVGGLVIAGPMMGIISGSAVNLLNIGNIVNGMRTVVRIPMKYDQIGLNKYCLQRVELRPNRENGFELEVPVPAKWDENIFGYGARKVERGISERLRFTGDEALRVARVLLPRINASGGNATVVTDAVRLLGDVPDAARVFTSVSRSGADEPWWVWADRSGLRQRLGAFPAAQRLAMEMALHESDERRALEGELAALETRWKEAEEIAAISDDLFVPSNIAERLRSLKRR